MIRRLFIASRIREPGVLMEMEGAWEKAAAFLPSGSWRVRETEPHITMRFIGDVDTGDPDNRRILQELREDLGRTAEKRHSIPLLLGHLHTFPGVLWSSIGGTGEALEALNALRFAVKLDSIRAEIKGLRMEFDRYDPWLPHVTLGRFEARRTEWLTFQLRDSNYPAQLGFRLESLEILESRSQPDGGPEYAPLEDAPAMMLR